VDSLTGVVTGLVSGLETVYYTNSHGCDTQISIQVDNVSPIYADRNPICQGDSELIHTSYSLSTSAATYRHTSSVDVFLPVPAVSPGDTFFTFKAVAPGLDTLYYILTGCPSFVIVTVDPLSPIFADKSEICSGDTIHFSNPVPGGTWSNDFPTIGTINPVTGVYQGFATGGGSPSDNVYYTLPGVSRCKASYSIVIHALPDSIVGPDSICAMTRQQYFGFPSGGGATWNFSSSNPLTDPIDILSGWLDPSPTATGRVVTITYALIYHPLTPFACSITKTVTVEPLAPIMGGPTVICFGDPVLPAFVDSALGGTWSVTNTAIGTIDLGGNFHP